MATELLCWRDEKDKKVRDLVMKFLPTEVELEETHLLAIGGLVAFREYLQMLAAQAVSQDWPDSASRLRGLFGRLRRGKQI